MSIGSAFYRGPTPSMDRLSRRAARLALEYDVQNKFGPIVNIKQLSDIDLYGLRDQWNNRNRAIPWGLRR